MQALAHLSNPHPSPSYRKCIVRLLAMIGDRGPSCENGDLSLDGIKRKYWTGLKGHELKHI